MTNDQILRKLAEVEGYSLSSITGTYMRDDELTIDWNPLTNWSDCGPLQESHDVWTESDGDGWHGVCDGCRSTDPDLKRAICLAIVESEQ